ncbi:hypothetical protein V2J09_010735 [Rumex salicifolius]
MGRTDQAQAHSGHPGNSIPKHNTSPRRQGSLRNPPNPQPLWLRCVNPSDSIAETHHLCVKLCDVKRRHQQPLKWRTEEISQEEEKKEKRRK